MQAGRTVRLLAAAAAFVLSLPAGSADDARERAERLAAQAEKVLDSWSGEPEKITEASELIGQALQLDAKSGHAMVEAGRAIIMGSNSVSGEAGRAAASLFHRATQLDPPYGRAFVLQGYLYTEQGRLFEAKGALSQASELVPDDPWLKLNWGAFFTALTGRRDKEIEYAREALPLATSNPKAIGQAYEVLMRDDLARRDRAAVDTSYARIVAVQPRSAVVRGFHARDLIMYFGDFDAGERLAREALAISGDYPHARQTLSLALYGRWALAARDGAPLSVREPLYQIAQRNDPGGRNLPECASQWEPLAFVYEGVASKGVKRRDLHRC